MELIAAGLPRQEADERTDEERAVVAFAEAMVDPAGAVDDTLFGRVLDLLGDAGVVELGAWIALQSLYSSFNRTFGVEAQGFSPRAE